MLPTGTVTFAFTDISGSTERWERDRAAKLAHEVLASVTSTHQSRILAGTLMNLAGYHSAAGDLDAAAAVAAKAIRAMAPEDLDGVGVAISIGHLALVHAKRSQIQRAARLAGYTEAAYERHGFVPEANERRTLDALAARLDAEMPEDEIAGLKADGAALTPEAAIELALG
jgi:hypothetical protein